MEPTRPQPCITCEENASKGRGALSATYHEKESKSLLIKRKVTDSWFLSRYSGNIYRGCEHGCIYCDGRAEKYYVPGNFARDISVKTNAVDLLEKELKRIKEPGFFFLGGGVCDAYQPAEKKYELARGVLELISAANLSVHVLTKSTLVERDLDLLQAINSSARSVLSFSIQTLDDDLRRRFEPRSAPIEARFELLETAKKLGLGTGIFAMPVLPGLSDQPVAIDRLVERAERAGVDFVAFGGMTLRPGRQKDGYFSVIREHHGDLLWGYERIYRDDLASGRADSRYYDRVDSRFLESLQRHQLPARMPRRLFTGMLPVYTEAAVLLEHEEHEQHRRGRSGGGLSRAGFAIQEWARKIVSKRGRRKDFDYRDVEGEFQRMVDDGSLLEVSGMNREALSVIRDLFDGSTATDGNGGDQEDRAL